MILYQKFEKIAGDVIEELVSQYPNQCYAGAFKTLDDQTRLARAIQRAVLLDEMRSIVDQLGLEVELVEAS